MTGNDERKIGGLLLAAGGASRFGSPKQLIEFEGQSLIRRAAKALLTAGCSPVIIILGAEIERSAVIHIADLRISSVINLDWETGMSSSIKAGVEALVYAEPKAAGVLITLCDQPLITGEMLQEFLTTFRRTRAPIIASDYGKFRGVPALFSCEKFPDLYSLTGDKGARDLIQKSRDVVTISARAVLFDIDVPEDLIRLETNLTI